MPMIYDFEEQFKEADGQDTAPPTIINASDWLNTEPPTPDQILVDTFDRGDKIALIGSSKLRKTFFLLQFLLSLAAGIAFLGWHIPKPRRIFHIQFEIQPNHFHRRVRNMARALGITSATLGDRFQILNARGLGIVGTTGVDQIAEIVKPYNPDIISFDPLYKIADGVENAAEDVKTIMNAFDKLAKTSGASIMYVHHDAKGFSGDRDIRDRGAGSNVLGRDYDACITLTPHASEPDAAIVETLLRNYRPQEPFTALWTEDHDTDGYRFDLRQDIAPTKKTSAQNKAKVEPPLDAYLPAALDLLQGKPMSIAIFKDTLRTKAGLTHSRTATFINWAISGPHPPLSTIEKRGRGENKKIIGLTEHIAKIRSEDI